MKFDHFQFLMGNMFQAGTDAKIPSKYEEIVPQHLHPLVLAYIGDAFFSLYIRTRLLFFEQNKVRVLHSYDAQMVSAVMQALAYKALEAELTQEENNIVKRGRNAKSKVPKSATVGEYRYSTGFEALLGYLYLSGKRERLLEIAEKAFLAISREMTKTDKDSGEIK
ncbi:hypothetical protein P22_3877 [Propionispora sp. 2/2-37]|uniref:Mini-ribonuclease 3 n=1 Tax=Propionispora sp. 2/2-37 TaxID=1677858 RepID=UPI0006BB7507|nr:ribonuclease III domain-containing protein [Propionispora sp. 2/2-37]CUH97733.1 hypothetical protein P22_3877 [Propionispora sp. 2/2-37]